MTSSSALRLSALAALESVEQGSTADAAESDLVDFTEEAGTVGAGGIRRMITAEYEPAAVALASEVACLANSDGREHV